MNYYSRYPAHYLAATLHLSMEQDGAYNRLMDWAYSNEVPIPDAKKYVIGRAQNSREKRAINDVLSEFFLLTETGWIQKRIEAEILKAAPKIEAARINGLKGGRPRKQKPSGFPTNNPVGFQNETQQEPSAKAPQSPISIQEQEQEQELQARALSQDPAPATSTSTEAGRACVLLKQAGCARVNPSHEALLAALSEGVSAEAIRDTYLEKPDATNPFAYAIATARSRHAEGPKPVNTGPPQRQATQSRTLQAIEKLQQVAANAKQTRERNRERLDARSDHDRPEQAALPELGRPAVG